MSTLLLSLFLHWHIINVFYTVVQRTFKHKQIFYLSSLSDIASSFRTFPVFSLFMYKKYFVRYSKCSLRQGRQPLAKSFFYPEHEADVSLQTLSPTNYMASHRRRFRPQPTRNYNWCRDLVPFSHGLMYLRCFHKRSGPLRGPPSLLFDAYLELSCLNVGDHIVPSIAEAGNTLSCP